VHIYSHIEDKLHSGSKELQQEWSSKIDIQKKLYGTMWDICIEGNIQADLLAKQASSLPAIPSNIPSFSDDTIVFDQHQTPPCIES